jgi:histidinol-phosphate aminotransferase
MKDFIYNKKKVNLISRIRIPENRDLKKGVRLNRNERVENFDTKIISKIFQKTQDYDLGKYPDQSRIYNILSKFLRLKEENLSITSGIDGSIKSIFEIFSDKNDRVGVLSPTYAMYEVYSNLFKTKIYKISYQNFKLDRKKLHQVIKDRKVKIIFIPNPNQPIEDNLSLKEIEKICKECKKNKILLVIDEAYHMFGSQTAAKLCLKYENIVILRTFSKSFGLPSIRLGYVIAHKKIIQIFNSYRLSYESNFLSDTVAEYFIKNFSIIKKYNKQIIQGREYLKLELKKLRIQVIGKKANFLLINFRNKKILKNILNSLKSNKIYVKSNYKGDLSNCILVTCGNINTMKKLLKIIKNNI